MNESTFRALLEPFPLIAILRGVVPGEVVSIGEALFSAGFRIIEVPLNSPEPLESVRLLAQAFGTECLIGAGTVTDPTLVPKIAAAGGRLIVMPHSDVAVIRAAKAGGLWCTPGIATPTEGFAALAAGADALKMFPAEVLGPSALRAWRSVFPRDTRILPVGGITPDSMGAYRTAGAAGFGLGSALYRPGMSAADVARTASAFAVAWVGLR